MPTSDRPFFSSITPRGLLSFAPDMQSISLNRLNILIGANGSGKSNFLEVLELLKSTSTDLAGTVRDGGGVREWIFKGDPIAKTAEISSVLRLKGISKELTYSLQLGAIAERVEVLDEKLEDCTPRTLGSKDVYFYYRFQQGHPVINVRTGKKGAVVERRLSRESLNPQQSVLSQRKDPEAYPEVTQLARQFDGILTFRDWHFGRYTLLRQPQPADLPPDALLPDARNLGLLINQIEHSDTSATLNSYLRRFLPRFSHISTRVHSGTIQIFLHEDGLKAPIPATRLSDGTIRFIALLVALLRPETASVLCIEEPELGLHPDALDILAELLVSASKVTQVIVTTHSDILLSSMSNAVDDVLVCENQRGRSSLKRLDRDQLDYWLDKYTLGEIWRAGEIGGNP